MTAAVPPGDERMLRLAIEIASRYKPLTTGERRELLASTEGVTPIFAATGAGQAG